MSYSRESQNLVEPKIESNYRSLNMVNAEIFTNGIDIQFNKITNSQEMVELVNQLVETLNNDFQGKDEIDVNFAVGIHKSKSNQDVVSIYYYSRKDQTSSNKNDFTDKTIVIDNFTRDKIQRKVNKIFGKN
jgi:DNA-binding MltR family transcriptional regulator